MRNEIIWIFLMIINFSFITFSYRKFGKIGLYIWIPISVILANLQVVVTLQLFGMYATLGNIIYGTGYLATDILSEEYGKKDADLGVDIGFFTLIAFTLIMFICTWFNLIDNVDIFRKLYAFIPRICVASLIAYYISNKHDTWSFEFWKVRFPKHLWLRNNGSTMVSQMIDSIIFTLIAFYGVLPFNEMFQIFLSTYIMKFVVALFDTPFIYLATMKKPKKQME